MHMVSRLALVALCGMCCGTFPGCATPSGQALADWVSGSLGRLRNAADPARLVVPEIRRTRSLIGKVQGYPAAEVRHASTLIRSAADQADRMSARTQRLPGRVLAAVDGNTARARRRVVHLVAPDSLLRKTLDPGRQVAAVRRIPDRLPEVLGLCRPILPGPGDPDRQTGAHPTGPTQTWVEKILWRVRL